MLRYLKKEKLLLFLMIVFNLISSLGFVFVAILLQKTLDIVMSKDLSSLLNITLFSIVYIILLGIFMYLQSLFSKKIVCKVTYRIRSQLFKGIMNQGFEDFHEMNISDYISMINNDVKLIEENYLLPLFEILQFGVIFIASLGIMIYFDIIVTICVVIAILFMLIVPNLFGKVIENRQNAYSKNLSLFVGNIKDILSGFEIINSYSMNKSVTQKFEKSNMTTTDSKYQFDKLVSLNEGLSMSLSLCVQIFVVLLSAYFIIIGKISIGVLMGMVQATSNLANPLLIILSNIPKMKSTDSIVEKIVRYEAYYKNESLKVKNATFENSLSIENLSFSYTQEKTILNNITYHFVRGKKYVIVGKSGCGKTTLIKLLTGNYLGYEGQIKYDGEELHDLDMTDINDISSIIHQNVYMFDETILDNICLYQDYSKDIINTSLKESGILDFVDDNKDGLLYRVGENGSHLSGGQKQRIAVARALIRDKPLVILDEGTSAIDMQTAYDIENKLLQINNLTLITITHNLRKELLEAYDNIIYMEDGKIIEYGTFHDLLQKKSSFYDYLTLKVENRMINQLNERNIKNED